MYCLRCGRDTKSNQVFCSQCQENMEKYPVRPGTNVRLPRRKPTVVTKKKTRRKKSLSSEEQILVLRKALRRSRALVCVLFLLFALAVGTLFYSYVHWQNSNLGKNYTVDTTQQGD